MTEFVFTIDRDISPERLEEYKKHLNVLIGYDAAWTIRHPKRNTLMQAEDPIDALLAQFLLDGYCPSRIEAEIEVRRLREVLNAAGYRIELDPNQLLEKGEKLFKPVRSQERT